MGGLCRDLEHTELLDLRSVADVGNVSSLLANQTAHQAFKTHDDNDNDRRDCHDLGDRHTTG
jgi:hypothetical protein